jgi:quinohemoprotein ethanol dehydrogenase
VQDRSGITSRRSVIWFTAGVVALGGATAAGAIASTQSKPEATAAASTVVPPPALTATQFAAPSRADWLDFGGNSLGDRYSVLDGIDTNNVKTLKAAWQTTLGEPKADNVGGGLEYGGTYYIQSSRGDVFALNAITGKLDWKYVSDGSGGGRGLAMGNGLIYAAQNGSNHLVAINAVTGKRVWRTKQLFPTRTGITLPGPISYTPLNGGEVFDGTAGTDSGNGGWIFAVDAKTGKLRWKYSPVPQHKGDPGYSTWGPGSDLKHGGGGVWTEPEVDPQTGFVIFATSNAAPYVNRPKGDDKYTASTVALNAKTGKFAWGYQEVHHDSWDYDTPQAPTMFNMIYHGKVVPALDQPTKPGLNFVLNRRTGKPIIPVKETKVPQSSEDPGNSLTQPIPAGQRLSPNCAKKSLWVATGGTSSFKGPDGNTIQFGCVFTPLTTTHFIVNGYHDVSDWLPGSYSQKSKLVNLCITADREKGYEAIPKASAISTPGSSDADEVLGISGGENAFDKKGYIVAINPVTNRIAWKSPLPGTDGCYSGIAATAGALTFVGDTDGRFLAYNSITGKLLWKSPKLDGTIGSPPIVYEGVDGREYVTLMVGGTSEGDQSAVMNDTVYAFALPNGTRETVTKLPTTAVKPPSTPVAKSRGEVLFDQAGCASCHTLAEANAHGTLGPNLDALKPTEREVDTQVTNGGGQMPSFKNKYTAAQITQIAKFVSSVAGKK